MIRFDNLNIFKVIRHIVADIKAAGKLALIVGGSVRDSILGKEPKDIDIEVYGISLQELENFLSTYGRVDLVGKSFGIIKFLPFDHFAKVLGQNDEMPTRGLVIPIGISGCGKSTFRNSLINNNENAVIVCPDDIRRELTGDVNDQSRNAEVFKIVKERAAEALKAGKLVFIDATNVNTKLRNTLIGDIFKLAGQEFDIYYKIFECDPQVSKERIAKAIANGEDRANVPAEVIDKQYEAYLESVEIIKIAQGLEEPYDFSVPRRENKIGKGHKGFEVIFDPDITIEEAASRRDFTFNALAYDPLDNVMYDYFGGIEDINNKIIRHTSKQFVEDPLRILRAMQFQARMGFEIAEETYKVMREMIEAGEMDTIAKERIAAEWIKWAEKGIYHDKIFEFLDKTGYGHRYLPELMKLRETKQDPVHHPEGNVEEHTKLALKRMNEIVKRENVPAEGKRILIFAILFHDIAKPLVTKEEWSEEHQRIKVTSKGHESLGAKMVLDILPRLGLCKDDINAISLLIDNHMAHANIMSIDSEKGRRSAINKLFIKLNGLKAEYLTYVLEADITGRLYDNDYMARRKEKIRQFSNYLFEHIRVYGQKKADPILRGNHLIELGLTPGPQFRDILDEVYELQTSGEINSLEEAIRYVKEKFIRKQENQ